MQLPFPLLSYSAACNAALHMRPSSRVLTEIIPRGLRQVSVTVTVTRQAYAPSVPVLEQYRMHSRKPFHHLKRQHVWPYRM
jgi:hypothetical protein